jgi:UDP-4-amino-4-deoxy-L-arabinose-oxoglutarate aminotransferase
MKGLQERGIPTVVNYRAIHQTSYLRDELKYQDGQFPVAEDIGDRTISLPFYPGMPDEHIDIVCDAIEEVAAEVRC